MKPKPPNAAWKQNETNVLEYMLNFQLTWKQPCPKCHESGEVIHAFRHRYNISLSLWRVRKEYQPEQPADEK